MEHIADIVRRLLIDQDVTSSEAASVNRRPEIDSARKLISADDIPTLLRICNDKSPGTRLLAINLLHRFSYDTRVQETMRNLWRDSSDFSVRHAALWRLLDIADLSAAQHDALFSFVCEHWAEFLHETKAWHGANGDLLSGLRSRLSSGAQPDSKRWIYVCAAAAADDHNSAHEFIESHSGCDDAFLAKVANYCLRQIDRGH
ncbi:MAG TPA: hypothetical protein VN634_19645 [Candidatus Limnocylindrales bacterium]|nr:hypothetical protein [Candidatus Limnocylindrales bacterium]